MSKNISIRQTNVIFPPNFTPQFISQYWHVHCSAFKLKIYGYYILYGFPSYYSYYPIWLIVGLWQTQDLRSEGRGRWGDVRLVNLEFSPQTQILQPDVAAL